MLERESIGEVEKLRVCRAFFGHAFYFTAAYRVGELLIDSGCAHTAGEMVSSLEGSVPPRLVLITHAHEDHIGANAALQARFGARILAHPLALPVMAAPGALKPLHAYRRLVWGYPAPSSGAPLGDRVASEKISLQVIPTPGHSVDHVAFFEPDRGWLFSGDAFVGGQDRELRPLSDAWQIVSSLRRLQALDAAVLFPGSGTVYHRPGPVIARKIAYLEELGGRILELHRRGLSPRRIRSELFGGERAIAWLTTWDFSTLNLVRSFLRPAAQTTDERLAIS
jgi:glyoxylase-like metal-dependent hydrolase (beta-lactamase superfamily II)